jgi:hypothetical protein
MYQPTGAGDFTVVSQSDPNDKNRGWAIEVGARVPAFKLIGNEGKQIRIASGHLKQLKPGTWNHLVVGYDGSRKQAGLSIYINGK